MKSISILRAEGAELYPMQYSCLGILSNSYFFAVVYHYMQHMKNCNASDTTRVPCYFITPNQFELYGAAWVYIVNTNAEDFLVMPTIQNAIEKYVASL